MCVVVVVEIKMGWDRKRDGDELVCHLISKFVLPLSYYIRSLYVSLSVDHNPRYSNISLPAPIAYDRSHNLEHPRHALIILESLLSFLLPFVTFRNLPTDLVNLLHQLSKSHSRFRILLQVLRHGSFEVDQLRTFALCLEFLQFAIINVMFQINFVH